MLASRFSSIKNLNTVDRKLSNSSMMLGLRICAVLELDPYEFAFESNLDWMKKIR